jgi:hypothetical protein
MTEQEKYRKDLWTKVAVGFIVTLGWGDVLGDPEFSPHKLLWDEEIRARIDSLCYEIEIGANGYTETRCRIPKW